MAKMKIAQSPTFAAVVQVPRIGAEPAPVEFQFRYMDRVALSSMFDRWNKARDAWAEKAQKDGATWEGSLPVKSPCWLSGWTISSQAGTWRMSSAPKPSPTWCPPAPARRKHTRHGSRGDGSCG